MPNQRLVRHFCTAKSRLQISMVDDGLRIQLIEWLILNGGTRSAMENFDRRTRRAASAKDLPESASATGRIRNNSGGPPSIVDEYLSPKEAARFFKCSKSFLDKRRFSGGGPTFTRLGRTILYRKIADLEAWARQRRFENTSQYSQDFK